MWLIKPMSRIVCKWSISHKIFNLPWFINLVTTMNYEFLGGTKKNINCLSDSKVQQCPVSMLCLIQGNHPLLTQHSEPVIKTMESIHQTNTLNHTLTMVWIPSFLKRSLDRECLKTIHLICKILIPLPSLPQYPNILFHFVSYLTFCI